MTNFDINGKVALITGGASGLGLKYAIALLDNGAKGVTLADLDPVVGSKAIQGIEDKFGKNKAIFVQTDVTSYDQFEDAFKKTISTFENIDILINNAGILNDAIWEKQIAINVNGTIHGILLGLENYIPKHKSGPEGLIVNISSVAGISPTPVIPIYTGTKAAVFGMTWSWGQPCHYDRTNVRVVGVCPGVTHTPLITDMVNRNLGPAYELLRVTSLAKYPAQSPDQIAPNVIKVIEKAPNGTLWVLEGAEEPYEYTLPDRFKIVNKVLLK